MIDTVQRGNCLEVMYEIPDKSIDMVLCDLPYGSSACSWDVIIPFEPLWLHYKRVIKKGGAIVLTASQPFTSMAVMSNLDWFKHEWIWVKNTSSGMMLVGKAPMKRHESILVFGSGKVTFNPQKVLGSAVSQNHAKKGYSYKNKASTLYGVGGEVPFVWSKYINPHTVLPCNVVGNRSKKKVHTTQKPVALFEYLIKTYTNEGDLVLDNTIGSGTTAIAAIRTNRHYIGIDIEQKYITITNNRIKAELAQLNLFKDLKGDTNGY